MAFIKNLFGNKKNEPRLSQPTFVGKQQKGASTFEVYKADDAESAKAFLLTKKVQQNQYYVVVDTPDGNWGMDIIGLYLERLRPWQTDFSLVQCDGVAHHPTATDNAVLAARNVNDNYVTRVTCGKCKQEWLDGVRYQNITVVRCPNCRTYNKVNSKDFTVLFVGQSTSAKYKSIAMLFYDNDSQARSGFAKITEACNSLSGLTQELVGTAFELRVAPTSVRIVAIRAADDNKRNHALEFASALGVFGDSKPQGTQQDNPNANSYSEFDDLLNKCALVQITNFDELPKAKPGECVACNGTGQLQYKSPHSGIQASHHCQFCGGKGHVP